MHRTATAHVDPMDVPVQRRNTGTARHVYTVMARALVMAHAEMESVYVRNPTLAIHATKRVKANVRGEESVALYLCGRQTLKVATHHTSAILVRTNWRLNTLTCLYSATL